MQARLGRHMDNSIAGELSSCLSDQLAASVRYQLSDQIKIPLNQINGSLSIRLWVFQLIDRLSREKNNV